MGTFYLDKRYYADKPARWVSFESSPGLEETKKDIYGKCVPCITHLYEQLREGRTEVHLGSAYTCWKVVAVLNNDEECVQVLAAFEKKFLKDQHIKGRFGSGDAEKPTRVIVFSVTDAEQRDVLIEQVAACTEHINPDAQISFHRGCAELYHELFGDWRTWKERETIKKPEAVRKIIDRIRKMLFWEKE